MSRPRGRASAVIPARLTFERVSRRFGDRLVLDEVSVEIGEAEVVCLLGPSGCGKTTLLRIAAGIEDVSSGRVLLDGRPITGGGVFVPPERRGIGLVFQDYALFPHLTVLDNVVFGLKGLSRHESVAIAMHALTRVGLDHLSGSYPHMLSGGEQQRAALARAIVPRPRVLLMDEPFSNLDRRMRDQVREETVGLLRETGATSVIVTHDPEEAMRIADRIVLMRNGRIAQAGTTEEVWHRPVDLGSARFLCDINELAGTVANGVATSPLGRFPAAACPEGPATVCVRPQALRLLPPGEGLTGRLIEQRFVGDAFIVDVAVMGVEHLLRGRVASPPRVVAGDVVGVGIDADGVLVFGAAAP
jgi:iron(III) transport system ATP-binding protein